MKVSEAKESYQLQERMRLVQEQRESGQTVRAWCAGNNIKESNFYYWLRETRKAALRVTTAKERTGEHALVRVQLPGSVTPASEIAASSAIHLQYKGARLDIPPGTKAEDLSIVLKALDGA